MSNCNNCDLVIFYSQPTSIIIVKNLKNKTIIILAI